MSVQIRGNGSVIADVDANTRAMRATIRHPDIAGNGAFRVGSATGLITTVAAASASAGHLFAARWTSASKLALITRFRARWYTIAGFTAAQEVGLDLSVLRSYSASHSGGTAISLASPAMKKRASYAATAFGDLRISTTAAITSGTHTFDSQPIAQGVFSELAAGAAVPKGFFNLSFSTEDMGTHPIVLATNEGLCLRNTILMGAGGTARVVVEMDWLEVDSY